MDRNRHSERNENASFSRYDSFDEMDSFMEDLKKSVSDENFDTSYNEVASRSRMPERSSDARIAELETFLSGMTPEKGNRNENDEDEFSSHNATDIWKSSPCATSRKLGLPEPGKRLQSLLNCVSSVRRDYRDTEISSRRTHENHSDREISESVENLTSDGADSQSYRQNHHSHDDLETVEDTTKLEETPLDEMASIAEQEVSVPSIVSSTVSSTEKEIIPEKVIKSKMCGRLLVVVEVSIGVLLGLGLVIGGINVQNPLKDRLFQELQRSVPATVTCENVHNNFLKTEMSLGNLTTRTLQDKNRCADMTIQRTDLHLSATSQISPVLNIYSVMMEGVEFPHLAPIALQDSWRPEPIAPLFSDEVKEVLSTRAQSLESLRYLEEIKSGYLPLYREISAEVVRINTDVETLETTLRKALNVEELTPDVLKSEAIEQPELIANLEKMGNLRGEAIEIQNRWMELNQNVATDLAKIRDKIAEDGQAFSSILQYEFPTEKILSNYLFHTDTQKRLAESLDWISAVSHMAELGTLTGSRKQAESLTTNGSIELFGQNFTFDADWDSNIEPECQYSYRGRLRLHSGYLPAELLHDAYVTVACRKKGSSPELRTVSARIPIVNDTFVWGDYKSLPLYGQFQDGTIVLDLTLANDGVHGTITLEMNQIAFKSPEKTEENAQILFSKLSESVLPTVRVEATISGKQEAPEIVCRSTLPQELLPAFSVALQEIHQATRKEMIASIYEQLKNAETAFNGILEPFYQEILQCAKKTDIFRNFPGLTGKVEPQVTLETSQREAIVEVVPMNLAHLDVNQSELDENIPVYNPNMGITPVESATSASIGNQAKTPENKKSVETKPTEIRTLPVKKVAQIDPIVPELTPESSTELPTTAVSVPPTPPMPNVADPVLYSQPTEKQLVPMDVPPAKKKAMPLPMGQSNSHFGN